MNYVRNLWRAICADPQWAFVGDGWLIARSDYVAGLEARIAEFEKQAMERFTNRSAASRKAHETRKAKQQPQEQQ